MADNKSREGEQLVSEEASLVRNLILKKELEHVKNITPEQLDTIITLVRKVDNKTESEKSVTSNLKTKLDIDCSDAIKGLKAVQREARNATQSLAEFERKADQVPNQEITINMDGTDIAKALEKEVSKLNQPTSQDKLLVIEIDDEEAVPKLFYKGEEIRCKNHVSLDWHTMTDQLRDGGLTYSIEYNEDDKDYPIVNRIESRVKGHAFK